MLVRELMSTDVVTVGLDATLGTVADRLLTRGVGSAIVVDGDETPLGIVTESDVLRAARETDAPLSSIPVREVGHQAVITTTPDTAIPTVARRMADESVKKVPVMDGVDLVGMITLTDVVWHLSDLRAEVDRVEAVREEWGPD
ncbi:CBS domain-containing protein [Haloarcula marina]|uniref:CBS domain-containing protein n=1 Tax=Haloarcula marina TaxID=2961574 RepID=UPI0020B875CF|nr:CBS domain-containing protein [Halomicroarcula marina]